MARKVPILSEEISEIIITNFLAVKGAHWGNSTEISQTGSYHLLSKNSLQLAIKKEFLGWLRKDPKAHFQK